MAINESNMKFSLIKSAGSRTGYFAFTLNHQNFDFQVGSGNGERDQGPDGFFRPDDSGRAGVGNPEIDPGREDADDGQRHRRLDRLRRLRRPGQILF